MRLYPPVEQPTPCPHPHGSRAVGFSHFLSICTNAIRLSCEPIRRHGALGQLPDPCALLFSSDSANTDHEDTWSLAVQ